MIPRQAFARECPTILSGILCCSVFASTAQAETIGKCKFDVGSLAFGGSPVDQAECLLSPVGQWGTVGSPLQQLPTPLDALVGKPVTIERSKFEQFLERRQISLDAIGGSLADSLSRARNNDPHSPLARYFVIHDTSSPNFEAQPFPSDIDSSDRINSLSHLPDVVHVFVNRLGASRTLHGFGTPWRATRFESKVVGLSSKGLFLHVELIQPRRSDPAGGVGNDAIAPNPGFTDAQLERLALLYVAASLRAGTWLVPSYHAAIDFGLVDAHDDPQQFNLAAWAAKIDRILADVK